MQPAAASAVINIIINSSTANAGAAAYGRVMNNIVSVNQRAAQDSALSWSSIFGANFFANLAADATRALTTGLADGLKNMTQYAARTEELGIALSSLAKVNNLNTASVREQEKALEGANIAVQASREVLAQFIATGLPLEKASPLAAVAKDLAVISGLSSSEEFENLIRGITTLQIRVLRTAGVFISLEDAEKKFAQANGRSTESLTAQEKQHIALNAVLEYGRRATGLYEQAMTTAAKQQRSLIRVQQDFASAVGTQFIPILGIAVKAYTELLKIFTASPTAFVVVTGGLAAVSLAIVAMNTAQLASLPVISQVISSISLMGKVMAGTASLIQGSLATTALWVTGWAAVVAVLGAVVYAIYEYNKAAKEQQSFTVQEIDQLGMSRAANKDMLGSLQQLSSGNADLTERQKILTAAYDGVNIVTQARVVVAQTEADKIAILVEAYQKLNEQDQIRLQTSAMLQSQTFRQELQHYEDLKNKQVELGRSIEITQAQMAGPGFVGETGVSVDVLQEQERQFAELGKQIHTSADEARNYFLGLQALSKATGQSVDDIIRQDHAFQNNSQAAEQAISTFHRLSIELGLAAGNAQATTRSIDTLTQALVDANTTPLRREAAKNLLEQLAEQNVADPAGAVKQLNDLRKNNKALDDQLKFLQGYDKASKLLQEQLSPKEPHRRSPAQSLTDSVEKLKFEVKSYQDLTSKPFQLRFQKEELERVKKDFESIIDLRRELGIPLNVKLPDTAEAARQEVEHLNRVKTLRDDILKIFRETQDAEDRLLVAQVTATAAVTDARTRADTAYLEGVRKRRDAEAQLTADIATQIRRRADLESNALRSRQQAEAEAFNELLNERNQETFDTLKQIARIQALAGASFAGNPLIDAARGVGKAVPDVSPVVGRLDKSNDLLQQILNAIQASGLAGATEVTSGGPGTGASARFNARSLAQFARSQGFQVTATTGGHHNVGSLHYLGLAADVRTRDKTPEQIDEFIEQAINAGIRVVDERTRFPGEKVYGGAHLHLEENDKRAAYLPRSSRLAGLDARVRMGQGGASRTPFPNTTPRMPTGPAGADTGPSADALGGSALATRPRINPLAALGQQFFGLSDASPASLGTLGPEALSALQKYLEAQRDFVRNSKEQVIGVDRLNQALNVNFTQVRQLEVAQDRLDRLRSGDAVSKQEALNDAELKALQDSGNALTNIIQKEEYLAKLRGGDAETLRRLAEIRKSDRANQVTAAEQELDALKEQAGRGGRDAELERLQTQKELLTATVEAGTAESALERQRALFANDEYRRARQQTDLLGEQAALEKQLFDLEQERITGPINEGLRVRIAREDELLNIQRADLKAQEDIARSVVQINDAENIHYDQANARVIDHISKVKSMTDIYSDARIAIVDKVWGGIDTLVDKLTSKLPIVGSILHDILAGVLKLALNQVFMRLFFPDLVTNTATGAGGGGAGGGGGIFSGGLGNILSFGGAGGQGGSSPIGLLGQILTGARGGGSGAAGAGVGAAGSGGGGTTGSLLQQLLFGGGGLGTRPRIATITSEQNAQEAITQAVHEAIHGGGGAGGGILSGIGGAGGGGGLLAKLGGNLAGLAPLLGLGLGAQLGAPAGVGGQLLGGFGGLLGGIAGAGALGALGIGGGALFGTSLATGGGLTAVGGVGGIFGAGGILGGVGSIFSGIGGALGATGAAATALGATVILAPLAAALLIGTYFISRSAERRREERQRTQILVDAKSQLQDILNQVRSGNMDSVTALTQAAQIRANYIQQVSQLKDKKTRNIALATVRELDSLIEQIKGAGRTADFARAQADAFVPTFALGGVVGYASGLAATARNSSDDNVLGLFNRREIVITPNAYYALGGNKAFQRAGVPGAGMGDTANRTYDAYSPRPRGGGATPDIQVVAFADEATADAWVKNARSKTVAKKVKVAIRFGQDDGLLKTVEKGLAGDF
jgi:hypothetical protein